MWDTVLSAWSLCQGRAKRVSGGQNKQENKMEVKFSIETSVIDSKVYQSLHQKIDDICCEVTTWVTDTREAEIKKALIKLGWTPPKGE